MGVNAGIGVVEVGGRRSRGEVGDEGVYLRGSLALERSRARPSRLLFSFSQGKFAEIHRFCCRYARIGGHFGP